MFLFHLLPYRFSTAFIIAIPPWTVLERYTSVVSPSGLLFALNSCRHYLDYIAERHPDLVPLYGAIYQRSDRTYWAALDEEMYLQSAEQSRQEPGMQMQ